jgi:hypothetical protein
MQPKVLIIVGDASETLDTMYPYYRQPCEGTDYWSVGFREERLQVSDVVDFLKIRMLERGDKDVTQRCV